MPILRQKQQGFTIIEVLIVLAIAGLIILIVFLAVPALQRNSRNTQRKNDVSAIGGALSEAVSNNNGQLPAEQGAFNSNVMNNAKVSYYETDKITYTKNTSAVSATTLGTDEGTDTVKIETYAKCNGNDVTSTGATLRSVVALYNVESSGGNGVQQCQEL